MNLNKLFPRLSIRAKLSIAFASLATLPVALLAVVAAGVAVPRLRARAQATLEHDVTTARTQAEQLLTRVQYDVEFLSEALLEATVLIPRDTGAHLTQTVTEFVERHPALFQVRVISDDGTIVFRAGTSSIQADGAPDDDVSGFYYIHRARELGEGDHLTMPVELRAARDAAGVSTPVPAIAVVVAVRDSSGVFHGAVVGEAFASVVFGDLDNHSPELPGTTVLLDSSGLILYHSERKRDWRSLLAEDLDTGWLAMTDTSQRRNGGRTPTTQAWRSQLVSLASVDLGQYGAPLTLARAVPLSTIKAPVRQFLSWTVIAGSLIVIVVSALAMLAARQMTEPIYQLREGAARLARGEIPPPLTIQTNDELEEFATDFALMAETLTAHRRELEEVVARRTRELQTAHAELTDILAHSADAIVGTDDERRVRVWNRGAERLFGYAAQEAIGRNVDELLTPTSSEAQAEREYLDRELARTGAVVNLQAQRTVKGGKLIPVSVTETVITDDAGTPHGMSLIFRDTSLQAKVEDHMRRSERLAAISVMAAGIAHEINNPLAIITNRLECMEAEIESLPEHASLRGDLAVLRDHTTRLSDTTRDLLRFARDGDEQPGQVNLGDVAGRLAHLLERTLIGRHIRIDVVRETEPPPVIGSASALETVCMNLLLNAADAMPSGGTITITTRHDPSRDLVELRVADDGVGVPDELRERIFEPFFTTKGVRGTGLGLSLCRSIVERHGGHIWVEGSPHGSGSVFVAALKPAAGGDA